MEPLSIRQRFVGAIIPILFTVACSSPTGPSDQFPNVAGNYSGTTTINFPELGNVTCSTTTSITQNGDRVSVAPLQLRGGSLCVPSIPMGDMTIDRNGSLGEDTRTTTISGCVYNYAGSGGFYGPILQGSFIYMSRTCNDMKVTINLTR
jgi:hypothetical protein